MPKYWLNTIFVADANILAEYWHEPNDTIYWEGPLSCGMYGTIAQKLLNNERDVHGILTRTTG